MTEGTDTPVLPRDEDVRASCARTLHRVLCEVGAVDYRGELLWRLHVRMGDPHALPVHEIATQIRGAERDRVPGPRARPAAFVSVRPPQCERRGEQPRGSHVEETMDQSGSPRLPVCFTPVGQAAHGGTERADESHTY